MNKFIILFLLSTTYIFSNINTLVSILPQQTFVKAIGGDKVNVSLMVLPGSSPHTYEPKPSQMIEVSKADLYFALDVEFEHVWLPKFKNLNDKMEVVNLSDGISKMSMKKAHHCDSKQHHHHAHHEENNDPHIWTAPANVKIIAQNIYTALAKHDPKNESYYKRNLDVFLKKVAHTDEEIQNILSTLKTDRRFMVFHPSWGYFANAYGLEEISVEVEGKSPKPKQLIHLLKEAKEQKVRAIFTQPEFSDTVAKIIAKELDIPVIKVSPLSKEWSQNLIDIAKYIVGTK